MASNMRWSAITEQAARQDERVVTIFGQQQRAVEIHPLRVLRREECRRDAEACSKHASDHDLEAKRLCFRPHGQGFGQPAGLVELDVDCLVSTAAARKIGSIMQAFIGAERDG